MGVVPPRWSAALICQSSISYAEGIEPRYVWIGYVWIAAVPLAHVRLADRTI